MPKTRMNCPNCRQPITADVNQLFDVGQDPRAKQIILAGMFNLAQCPHCGYQGNLATPMVYHDPDKELLLTYFPPELGMNVTDQERVIGPLINQVMTSLPQEKRKGYLLRPQTMFTLQGLVERVLEADGITKEMIQEQQKRLELLQRLMDASDDVISEAVKTDDQLMDAGFFTLLGRLAESAAGSGDQDAAQKLAALQEKLLSLTTFGKSYKSQTAEMEAAVQSLRDIGDSLTRDKLLDLFIESPTDTRLSILVSLTRAGVDYEFFQLLSNRIEAANDSDRPKLLELRDKLFDITRSIDKAVETRTTQARATLQKIIAAPNVEAALQENVETLDDFFMQVLQNELEEARKAGDLEKIGKLREIDTVLQKASEPPKEIQFIQDLLAKDSDAEQTKMFDENRAMFTQEFLDALGGLAAQIGQGGDEELTVRMERLYRNALRYSMRMNME